MRYFVAVAEELHFARAAERLHISQSPRSRAIRELERDLGVVLFVRSTRRVELTEAESLLLERSRRALAEIDGAIADARGSVHGEEGVLAIGYGPFSGSVVARIIEVLAREHPGLPVRRQEEVTPTQAQLFRIPRALRVSGDVVRQARGTNETGEQWPLSAISLVPA